MFFVNPTKGSKDIERTRNTVIQYLILNCELDLDPTLTNIDTAHRLIILNIFAKLFVNPTRGSTDIERTRKCDGQTDGRTDGQTDGQTDNGAKNNMSPHFMGRDII